MDVPVSGPYLPAHRPTPNPAHTLQVVFGLNTESCGIVKTAFFRTGVITDPYYGAWGQGPCQFIRFYSLARSSRKRLRR